MTSEGYILNSVSQGKPLWVVWNAMNSGATTKATLHEKTGLTENQVASSLRGLTYCRLIEQLDEYETIKLGYDFEPKFNFIMGILNNIMMDSTNLPPAGEAPDEEEAWGKQAVLPLTFEYFVSRNLQQFQHKKNKDLADRIDEWHRSVNYMPRDGNGSRNDLNPNKLQNWTQIAEFLGFLRPAQGSNYTVYLQPELLYRILVEASHNVDEIQSGSNHPRISIRECLEWISEHFFRVSTTTDEEIPSIIAQTLVELSAQDQIRLVEAGDEGRVTLQDTSRPATMDIAANSIEVRQ